MHRSVSTWRSWVADHTSAILCPKHAFVHLQDNHCDCGLFLLAFLEYFVFSPPKALTAEAVREERIAGWYRGSHALQSDASVAIVIDKDDPLIDTSAIITQKKHLHALIVKGIINRDARVPRLHVQGLVHRPQRGCTARLPALHHPEGLCGAGTLQPCFGSMVEVP